MSSTTDSADDSGTVLNDCGCCAGTASETPAAMANRPGLSAIASRVGTHSQFKRTMLARLSGSGRPALRSLTTRTDDDLSIALLDAWATVGDVLTFYQERIANEAYLRTATERLSVRELARLIDYRLNPGVAAGTYLAFSLEDAPGMLGQSLSLGTTAQASTEPPPPVVIDVGAKVQSVPAPGEEAQTFETVETIEARAEWNAIRPRLTRPIPLSGSMTTLVVQGLANNLKPGDVLLIVDDAGARTPKSILAVTLDEDAKTTRLDFGGAPPPTIRARLAAPPAGRIGDFPTRVELHDDVAAQIVGKTWTEGDLAALAMIQGWSVPSLVKAIVERARPRPPAAEAGAFAFRKSAPIFGYNAPRWDSLPATLRFGQRIVPYHLDSAGKPAPGPAELVPAAFPSPWETLTLAQISDSDGPNPPSVTLDSTYPGLVKDSWMALISPGTSAVIKVQGAVETTKTAFALSGKVSRVIVEDRAALTPFTMRGTTALVQSEPLALAELPITDLVEGDSAVLDRVYLGLSAGRRVILTGERTDLTGGSTSEVVTLAAVVIEAGFTVVTFDRPLAHRYRRRTVTINANVALATHGETVRETLGSGDAGQAFQRFPLRQPPLTYVSAPTPSGGETTLEVRVDDVRWHEVPSFFGHGPAERIYVSRLDEDGDTTVVFGDGLTGARPPTGQENVKAKYRKGIGRAGRVHADQLTQLMTRPPGVKGVTNPLAASGGADGEQIEDARANASLTVLTLGRIVSLRDYEDFARGFGGIGKALATWTWFGERRGVFVTIAGANAAEVREADALYGHLVKAMQQARDPGVPLRVKAYQPWPFRVSAAVTIDPDFLPDKVLAAVEQALRSAFGFDARALGQAVHLSEIVATMQKVGGVVAIDVREFYRSDQPVALVPHIAAAAPRPTRGDVLPAELLTLDLRPVSLEASA